VEDVITVVPLRFALAVLVGALVAGIFGVLIGIPVLRLRGDYLAIVTLAFGEIIKNVLNIFYVGLDDSGLHVSVTSQFDLNMAADGKMIISGPQGITGITKCSTFFAGFVILMITLFIVLNLINSRDGRAIMAIRDNRIAAESIGLNITKYKLMAFTVSAALAGAGGALYSHNLATLPSSKFNFNTSILILVFVVLGGIGNIRGSIIAAVVLTALPELLRSLSDYRMLIYAIVLIVLMLFNWAPKSLEWRERYLSRFFKKSAKEGK
jgi:branched-chain amino acid transport system permease protein